MLMPKKRTMEAPQSPLPGLLDSLILVTEEEFTKLFESARQARKLKGKMDRLRAGLG
jgi:hypothetical protein